MRCIQTVEMGQGWAWMGFVSAPWHSLLRAKGSRGGIRQQWGSMAGLSNLLLSQVLQINGWTDDPSAGEPLNSPASIP